MRNLRSRSATNAGRRVRHGAPDEGGGGARSQPRPASAAARRLISALRSQMAFDSVALRLTTPLLSSAR
jgi:hypothetical protein